MQGLFFNCKQVKLHLLLFILLCKMVCTRSSGKRIAAAMLSSKTEKRVPVTRRKLSYNTEPQSPKPKQIASLGAKIGTPLTPKTKRTTMAMAAQSSPDDTLSADNSPLLSLDDDIILAKMVKRPSKRNRSPYVADVWLQSEEREALAHVPNLDMGGKCIPGASLILRPAKDRKGNLVGKDAVNPKYGTPKCEFIAQLLRVDESALGYAPTYVGAHPTLGEKIAEQLVKRNLLGRDFPEVEDFSREVRNVAGTDMRADFVIRHKDPTLKPRILEVKTVVDTDYAANAAPDRNKCVYTSDADPYNRAGIFPWGNSNQKGPDGEKVVSARAIKHIRELTKVVTGDLKGPNGEEYDATVLFVVIRDDTKHFRPNHEACPSFCKYLRQAQDAGVQILAKQVGWGENDNLGKCFEGKQLEIKWPTDFDYS